MRRSQLLLLSLAASLSPSSSSVLSPGSLSSHDNAALSPFAQKLTAAVQPVLDAMAEQYNVSLSVAFAGAQDPFGFGVVAGPSGDRDSITTKNKIPCGSATKLYTATALLQAQEQGLLDLDTPAVQYVDPYLKSRNGTTLSALYNTDSVNAITVRQLANMQSGLSDYNDTAVQEFSTNPATFADDQTPYDYLHRWALKDILFPPGQGGAYSSIAYVLAGLTLAAVHNASDWNAFDQRSILPPPLQEPLADLQFSLGGRCSADPAVVHQYTLQVDPSATGAWTDLRYQDLLQGSCLNGWTMGNIVATPTAMAGALYNLFGQKPVAPLLSPQSLAEMKQFKALTNGWSVGLQYGLGCMNVSLPQPTGKPANWTISLGHAGEDFGSAAPVHNYHPASDLAFVFAMDAETGMNCSFPNSAQNFQVSNDATCRVWNAVIGVVTNGESQIHCPSPTVGPGQPTYHCASGAAENVCGGTSAELPGGDCEAWKVMHSLLGGTFWTDCADKFSDPCACAGVTCEVVDGTQHITELKLANHGVRGSIPDKVLTYMPYLKTVDLSDNTVFGAVPEDISTLKNLSYLNVSNNFLINALPANLPWSQLTRGCDIDGNQFSCPLPPEAYSCTSGGSAAPQCFDMFNVTSPACAEKMYQLDTNLPVEISMGALEKDIQALSQAAGAATCANFLTTHQCNMTLDWSSVNASVNAAKRAIANADAAANLCFLDKQWTGYIDGISLLYRARDFLPVGLPGPECTVADKAAILKFLASEAQCLPAGGTSCGYAVSPNSPPGCEAGGVDSATASRARTNRPGRVVDNTAGSANSYLD